MIRLDKALPSPPRPRRPSECGLFEVEDVQPNPNTKMVETALKLEITQLRSEIERLTYENKCLFKDNRKLQQEPSRIKSKDYDLLRQRVDIQADALKNILSFVRITASDCIAQLKERTDEVEDTKTDTEIRICMQPDLAPEGS